MKLKLDFKIFVFSMVIILFFIVSIAFSIDVANKEFEGYVYQNEVKKIGYLVDTLSAFYSENGGWESLIDNIDLWALLLEEGWAVKESVADSDARPKPALSGPMVYIINHSNVPIWDELDLGPRVSLFDKNKSFIVGLEEMEISKSTLFPITSEGKTIGWLGLVKGETIYQPLDQAFKQNQSKIFFIIGGIFLLILIFIVILFSKLILMPITRLATATKNLGSLNFNTRIPIESSDEIGELSKNFNEMAQKLQEYERVQKQWLSDISHELRTPLSVLTCEVDALKDGVRKPSQAFFQSLSNEMRHLIKLVNDINDISKIETGTFSIKEELVKPLAILSQEAHLFRKRFQMNNISMEVQLEQEAADIRIMGDANRLIQLFTNILENAVIHTRKPGKLIIRQTHDEDYISFFFEDSGPGVPEEALDFLFDRLYRLDSSRSRETGGSGLGLAICKSIVEMHKGKIRAQNIKGGGLMIEVKLPIDRNHSDPLEERLSIAA